MLIEKENSMRFAIQFHEEEKIFHLYNESISYILRIMENGQAEHLYFGATLPDRKGFSVYHEEAPRSQMSICVPEPSLLSLHYTKQEYPSYGTGDYRSPAFTILQENGSRVSAFHYTAYEIRKGKPTYLPLPMSYVESEAEALTLDIHFYDDVSETEMILEYTLYRDYPVLCRNTRFTQKGKQNIFLERALSMSLEFSDKDFSLLHLAGAWGRERYVKTRKLEMGIQSVQGLNGTCSGAEHNPFIALLRPDANEDRGQVYGFNLVYSGNFLSQVEVSTFEMTRVMLGVHPEHFSYCLREGESFQTPEALLAFSENGLNGLSHIFHHFMKNRLMHSKWKKEVRPILLNNWEATFFDFTEEKILQIAKKAKEVGAELFVLDDGWFGARNDDYRGLGDWEANLTKLPNGIKGLSEKVEAMGLRFGLWFELEMVNMDSDLYRAHPDWMIQTPGRFPSHARHQHVLDYSRSEVVDYIYEKVAKILRESKISYIKWDMNRYMSEPYSPSLPPEKQGEMMHRYILGVYSLYYRLTQEFPDILIESCASGGARFDAGLLYYAPQAWCSDDSDAGERAKIQYGTSIAYPIVSIGAHVSAVPNQQVYRHTPLETRANIAYFGTFGYELDLNLLSEIELAEVKREIAFMKEHRKLLQIDGDFYRLLSPFSGNECGFSVVSPEQTEAIALYFQKLNFVNASWIRFKLKGLSKEKFYRVRANLDPSLEREAEAVLHAGFNLQKKSMNYVASGAELMEIGIPIAREDLSRKGGDFASILFTLKEEV